MFISAFLLNCFYLELFLQLEFRLFWEAPFPYGALPSLLSLISCTSCCCVCYLLFPRLHSAPQGETPCCSCVQGLPQHDQAQGWLPARTQETRVGVWLFSLLPVHRGLPKPGQMMLVAGESRPSTTGRGAQGLGGRPWFGRQSSFSLCSLSPQFCV